MGWVYSHSVEAAARHLLSVLDQQESVDYSTFYDGTDAKAEKLRLAVGLEPDDDASSAETFMDLAVDQLQEQGVVTRSDLSAKLADDESDYRIAWTPNGRELAKGKLIFRHVQL